MIKSKNIGAGVFLYRGVTSNKSPEVDRTQENMDLIIINSHQQQKSLWVTENVSVAKNYAKYWPNAVINYSLEKEIQLADFTIKNDLLEFLKDMITSKSGRAKVVLEFLKSTVENGQTSTSEMEEEFAKCVEEKATSCDGWIWNMYSSSNGEPVDEIGLFTPESKLNLITPFS
jgi:hypothetical protein